MTPAPDRVAVLLAEEEEARSVDQLGRTLDMLDAQLADESLSNADRIQIGKLVLALHARLEARALRLKVEAEKAEKRREMEASVGDLRRKYGIPVT